MAFLHRTWFLINILSLDVVLAAMGGMCFFASFLEVDVPISIYLGLGLVVWGIYAFDHLLDARSMDTAYLEARRSFHLRHAKIIWVVLLLCVIAGLGLLIFDHEMQEFLPYVAALAGLAVGILLLGKYAGNVGAWTKEILIALVYVAGISIYPVWQQGLELLPSFVFLYLLGFFLLALINLWILSLWDREADMRHGFRSIASVIRPYYLERAIVVLGILLNLLFFGLLMFQPSFYHMHALIILLISHIHMVVFLRSKMGTQPKRQILEASFLITWLLLLLG
jgi:4-hydroxybenzoate polyprenyltransferase